MNKKDAITAVLICVAAEWHLATAVDGMMSLLGLSQKEAEELAALTFDEWSEAAKNVTKRIQEN